MLHKSTLLLLALKAPQRHIQGYEPSVLTDMISLGILLSMPA